MNTVTYPIAQDYPTTDDMLFVREVHDYGYVLIRKQRSDFDHFATSPDLDWALRCARRNAGAWGHTSVFILRHAKSDWRRAVQVSLQQLERMIELAGA